jgi:trimeric autotransporter adhesin
MIGADRWRRRGIFALVAAGATLTVAPAASADTYAPNRLGDHAPNGCTQQDCTLREAVTRANHHPGADTIVLRGGKTYDLALANLPHSYDDEDSNATGDLDVKGALTIRSNNGELAAVDANGIDRVFETGTAGAVDVTLNRLLVRGGMLQLPGDPGAGAATDAGRLRIVRSRVGPNTGDAYGGGVGADGATAKLAIVKSTITANQIGNGGGGGLGIVDGAHADLIGSTISHNLVFNSDGGGIFLASSGSLTATNSTITKNEAKFGGGGILATGAGDVRLRSVTVARNNGDANGVGSHGGGLVSISTAFTVRNTIVALNTVSQFGANPDCDGSFISAGRNLFTDLTGCSGFSSPPNIVTATPHLGALQNNGGPTKTIALLAGSQAIDHSGSGAPQTDQRGVKRIRPNDPDPDIGAFERKQ